MCQLISNLEAYQVIAQSSLFLLSPIGDDSSLHDCFRGPLSCPSEDTHISVLDCLILEERDK